MRDISRHQEVFDPQEFKHIPITIIGAGATGSKVWLSLIELGLRNISVYDDDVVEEHNLANQLFLSEDVGEEKVVGLHKFFGRKTGEDAPESLHFYPRKIEGDDKAALNGVVFLLTDTMESREEIAKNSLRFNQNVMCVIETRMAATHGELHLFHPNDPGEYTKWVDSLIPDDEAETSLCGTSISVGATSNIVANLAVWQMIGYLKDHKTVDKDVSFYLQPLIVTAQ